MENTNQQGFSMDEYNKFLKQIKAGSPVHKINFNLENPNAVVGMYLITKTNMQSYLSNFVDKTDVDYNTLLVFESRHVTECCQIIYGILYILNNFELIKFSSEFIINKIIEITLSRPLFHSKFTTDMNHFALSCFYNKQNIEKFIGNFVYIMENIWFVPYGQIDEMAKEAIKEFKKYEEGVNNE